MKSLRRLVVVVPAVVLGMLAVMLWLGRGTMGELSFLKAGGDGQAGMVGLVDQRPYQTARTLAAMAVSAEEQGLATGAERLADHEVDQAFATALREAQMSRKTLTGEAAALAQRVEELKGLVKDDQTRVEDAEAAAKKSGVPAVEGDDADVAKAQLGLDGDELTDAAADLARASGDRRGEIQGELAAREAWMKANGDAAPGGGLTAVATEKRYETLWSQLAAWGRQRNRVGLLKEAQATAAKNARELSKEHDAMEAASGKATAAAGGAAGSAKVAAMKEAAGMRVVMSILDDRAGAEKQLAGVYGQWQGQVWSQHRMVRYLILQSLAWICGVLLVAALLGILGRAAVKRAMKDSRRASTLETMVLLGAEGLGLLGVLVVIWGVPDHTPTILGLATAGLTVVFQDFILAFFGWFVLMGKNGMRVCDWVEINGVGGEVSEIGLFRTTLLETGNWTSRGHPTGRKVRFINSFAIRGQFFNFTTHGQWMWDEIKLNVPATADVTAVMAKMQEVVERESTDDTAQAEQEWRAATHNVGLSGFSAKPTMDLRPASSGVDVIVRFVTRANERFELRNRLYQAMLGMMAEMRKEPAGEAGATELGPTELGPTESGPTESGAMVSGATPLAHLTEGP